MIPKERVKNLLRIKQNPDLAILQILEETELRLETYIQATLDACLERLNGDIEHKFNTIQESQVLEAIKVINSIKGIKGDTGDKGDTVVGPKGDKGDRGEPGISGQQGEKGESVVGPRGQRGERGLKGERGFAGERGENGKDGKDGSPDTGKEIVDKINDLDIKPEFQIDAKHIKNLPREGVGKSGRRFPRGLVSLVQYYDLSSFTNGVTKSFTIPANSAVIWVGGSDAPGGQYRQTTDYVGSGTTTLTLTSQVIAPSSGATLHIIYAQ